MSDKNIKITNEDVDRMIKNATLSCIGYLEVCNSGNFCAKVELGIYTVTKNGHTVQIKKTPKALYSIFTKLVARYLSFNRKGEYYYYYRGAWRTN